ncbi:MAG: hypothetical protein IJD04_05435 [Desulfovibrionaceae bacterium]|nr:hypothetical protein [Desulfovibrionaceae bacterium]
MLKLNKLSLFRLALLSLLAMLMLSAPAMAQQAQGQAPDFKALTKDQPAFTESEVNLFLNDYPKLESLGEEEGVQYLISQGWTAPRFFYVMLKTGMCHEILQRGGGKEIINQLPPELRPQKGELELVKKNKTKFDKIRKQQTKGK